MIVITIILLTTNDKDTNDDNESPPTSGLSARRTWRPGPGPSRTGAAREKAPPFIVVYVYRYRCIGARQRWP